MSNPFDDENDQILEGFLCPICKTDLKTPDRLTAHVESDHSEEQDLLKSFKDIFITAKKKIRYFDDNLSINQATTQNDTNNSGSGGGNKSKGSQLLSNIKIPQQQQKVYYPPPELQTIGADVDHISYFKAIRYFILLKLKLKLSFVKVILFSK